MAELISILLRFGRKGAIASAMLAGLISGACGTALLALINQLMHTDFPEGLKSWMVWSFAGLCVGVPLTRIVSSYLFQNISTRTARDLRLELSRRVLAAPLRHLEQLGPHRLMVTLSNDVGSLSAAVTGIPVLAMNLALVIGCLVYMGWLSPTLLAVVLTLIVLGSISYQLPMMLARRRQESARETQDKIFRHLRNLTEGTKELKMHERRRSSFLEKLAITSEELRRLMVSARLILVAANSWGSMLAFVVIGLIYFLTPFVTETTSEILSGYTLILLYITGPMEVILGSIPDLMRAQVAAAKIRDLGISLAEEAKERVVSESPPDSSWSIWELRGVTHTYYNELQEDNFILGPLNLTLTPGEILFLIGGNGSGKTTLAKLMMGLYVPEEGEIYFNGESVTNSNRDHYRQHFSVVFSDYFLFPSLLGIENPELDTVARQYVRRLQLENKVRVEQGELSTTDLSAGQRKRLALLTAFLEDRPIYLFDEWAADQDPYFKKIFYHQILPELKSRGKTVIVVSHDDQFYHVADRIVKMQYGSIEYDEVHTDSSPPIRDSDLPLNGRPPITSFADRSTD